MTVPTRLPDAPADDASDAEWGRWARDLVRSLRDMQRRMLAPVKTGYVMSNVTETRTFDANQTDLQVTNDVLATLVDDLKADGKLRK